MNQPNRPAYYEVTVDTPRRLLLVRSPAGRTWQTISLGVAGAVCILVASYLLSRPARDETGALFFGLTGWGLGLTAILAALYTKEIEFNADRLSVIRRVKFGGAQVSAETLPFEQAYIPPVKVISGEYDSCLVQIQVLSGETWEEIPGYTIHHQAEALREKIKIILGSSR